MTMVEEEHAAISEERGAWSIKLSRQRWRKEEVGGQDQGSRERREAAIAVAVAVGGNSKLA